jgi:ketosteroid isomerase-like protein
MRASGEHRARWIGWPALGVLVLALLSPLARPATAQTGSDEATHEALRALRREVEAAFNKAGASGRLEDFEPILKYVDDDVVLAAMNGSLVVGKAGLIEYFKRTMMGSARTVATVHHTFEPAALTKLYGGDTGVVYGRSVGRYALSDGMSFEVNTIWTSTLVQKDGKWLLASFQFAPSIFDNPVATRAVRALYWGVGIAGGGALLLGFLLGRVTARARRGPGPAASA